MEIWIKKCKYIICNDLPIHSTAGNCSCLHIPGPSYMKIGIMSNVNISQSATHSLKHYIIFKININMHCTAVKLNFSKILLRSNRDLRKAKNKFSWTVSAFSWGPYFPPSTQHFLRTKKYSPEYKSWEGLEICYWSQFLLPRKSPYTVGKLANSELFESLFPPGICSEVIDNVDNDSSN